MPSRRSLWVATGLLLLGLVADPGIAEARKKHGRHHGKHKRPAAASPAVPATPPPSAERPTENASSSVPRIVDTPESPVPPSPEPPLPPVRHAADSPAAAQARDDAKDEAKDEAKNDARNEPPVPAPPPPPPAPTAGKPTITLYGFVEVDTIRDSTQSFQEPAGNGIIQRNETFAGSHARAMMGMRHSRLGVRVASAEHQGWKASAVAEMDFVGNQPANPPGFPEAGFFGNPTLRARHYFLKLESAAVDFLAGQTWQLFGWGNYFHPNTVEIQGVPGQVFSRQAQLRLSHVFKAGATSVELAVAAARPPQRDAGTPDGQAGLRLLWSGRKALHTMGATGTASDSLGIGVSGVFRRFVMPELLAAPVQTRSTTGWGVSVDALLPVLSGTLDQRANALTLTGSFVKGSGISDLFAGLTGGIGAPAYPAPAMGAAVVAPVDAGLLTFDGTGAPQTIDWTSLIVGLQYYLPPSGKVWLAANYSHMVSSNIATLAAPAGVFNKSDWLSGNLFWEAIPSLRLGLEYALFRQTRGDGPTETNHRVQLSAFYLF